MSMHPSLNVSGKDSKPRSVLKRIERIRTMLEKNQWKEGDPVYGLPKIKALRIKIKKEKAEKTAEGAVAAEGATPAAGAAPAGAAPAAKAAAPAKGAAKQEKK